MSFPGTGPGSAPAAVESAHNAAMGAKHFAVVQRQGEHTTELGSYHDKNVAEAALEEMVAKGFPREELSVRRVKGTKS